MPNRLLVVDLPDAGQASVAYNRTVGSGRSEASASQIRPSAGYFPASVLNSLLGGGYSSRLNQEIRIKRGLSYGAGSGFAWRWNNSNFSTRTQTKNESAPEVAELVLAEVKRLTEGEIGEAELTPRKSVLTGGFGRNIETTGGLVSALAELYTFDLPATELNRFMSNVNAISDAQIRDFAKANLLGGDIIIVGDYAKFKDDLAKRFPHAKLDVIKAEAIDLSKDNLRK
jgi:zinc protease